MVAAMAIAPTAAEARAVCGPSGAETLAKSAAARVYVSQGSVRSCHRARKGAYRLGARAKILDVQVAGGYAAVRERTADGQSLRVVDLRRARVVSPAQPYREIGLTKLDASGVAAFHAVRPDGTAVVATTEDVEFATVATVDDLGLKGTILAYRVGSVVTMIDTWSDADSFQQATNGTVLRVGDIRFAVDVGGVSVRRGGGKPIAIGGPVLHNCRTRSDCSGWRTITVAGGRVVLPGIDLGANGTNVTVHDLSAGTSRVVCAPDVKSSVITDTGKVACGLWDIKGKQIVSEGVVLDSGPSVDPASLVRRGDELVWLSGGVERTAPIPR